MLLVAMDMICYCSRNFGLLACIFGTRKEKPQQATDMISLDGEE